ncbi:MULTISPECIES: cupin domain-containing protein [unclassified Rubrivivax]|uniref:cupin domain-containing protein n=1 Tax=unclassified Rubrivivax TaxID=2649762 RepID=UPI001E5EA6D8|nr:MULTISPECIES: cupin domain-containing protein [unclassified Rubrivivax]MCC9598455.1 cupin domain-containing protein [Rubrivivax sp. JA1055]MCC9648155.1 cupin domain-containing protein [Rubrivivax sp. JA1029]
MELLTSDHFVRLANPGVESWQLLSPHNSASTRLTITRVVLAPGAEQPRHLHAASEQVWVAVAGEGTLLLADGATAAFVAGQVARFADGELHGLHNTGAEPFVYLSVTSPPLDFSAAYQERG